MSLSGYLKIDRDIAGPAAELSYLRGVPAEIHASAIGGMDQGTFSTGKAIETAGSSRPAKESRRHLAGADWLGDWRRFFPPG